MLFRTLALSPERRSRARGRRRSRCGQRTRRRPFGWRRNSLAGHQTTQRATPKVSSSSSAPARLERGEINCSCRPAPLFAAARPERKPAEAPLQSGSGRRARNEQQTTTIAMMIFAIIRRCDHNHLAGDADDDADQDPRRSLAAVAERQRPSGGRPAVFGLFRGPC